MRRSDLIFYCGALNLVLDVILNLVSCAGMAWRESRWPFTLDREHLYFSLVLDLEAASSRLRDARKSDGAAMEAGKPCQR